MSERADRRTYHSPRRREQARQTRRQILDAARRLFATRGYAATTLPAIAREAGISAPTITAVFGTKAALVRALIHVVVRGDANDAPLLQQAAWQEMLAEPDAERLLQQYAGMCRQIQERSADVVEIVQGAATADGEIAEMLRQQATRRLEDARSVAEALDGRGAVRPGMTIEHATDVLWVLTSAGNYRMLVTERGWLPEQYEEWLASSLVASVLPPIPTPPRESGDPVT